ALMPPLAMKNPASAIGSTRPTRIQNLYLRTLSIAECLVVGSRAGVGTVRPEADGDQVPSAGAASAGAASPPSAAPSLVAQGGCGVRSAFGLYCHTNWMTNTVWLSHSVLSVESADGLTGGTPPPGNRESGGM